MLTHPVYAHLPASTGYPKNNYLYSDVLWPTRWAQILSMASASQNLRWVEVITWNDWTESSLISPFKGAEMSDGNYLWSEDFPHTSMGKMMAPYIAAFKWVHSYIVSAMPHTDHQLIDR
jgi:glucan endo-1,3-alpha-glucosidase